MSRQFRLARHERESGQDMRKFPFRQSVKDVRSGRSPRYAGGRVRAHAPAALTRCLRSPGHRHVELSPEDYQPSIPKFLKEDIEALRRSSAGRRVNRPITAAP